MLRTRFVEESLLFVMIDCVFVISEFTIGTLLPTLIFASLFDAISTCGLEMTFTLVLPASALM